jgi:peptidyl-prolyl cis-trans isomerase SurA
VILDLARQKMAALQIIDPLRTPKQAYRVSEIFRAVDRPENDARVWAEIEAIEQQIRGGASFRDLARQHSQHPTAKLGGDKGWATAEQLDAELAGVVTALKVGELSRPVRGRGGWYLLGLQEVAPGVALKAQ